MNKTLSIGLAGFSFVIEEHAYIKLSDYLSALRSSLEESEADEIMHDIEIRIVEILKDNMGKREVVNDDDIDLDAGFNNSYIGVNDNVAGNDIIGSVPIYIDTRSGGETHVLFHGTATATSGKQGHIQISYRI